MLIIAAFGYLFIFIGIFFIITSVMGVVRFHDPLTKMHAVGLADSFAIPLILIGFIILTFIYNDACVVVCCKYLALLLIGIITSSTNTTVIASIVQLMHKSLIR